MGTENDKMTFDQLQRYRFCADVVETTRRKKHLTILDAGSHQGYLASFLPEDRIFNLDRCSFPERGFVRGNVLSLPFSDAALDVSVSLDILEHIAGPDRVSFLDELSRASGDILVIGAPFSGPEIREAEKLALEFCVKMTGAEHGFLAEHRKEGLPALDEVTGWAATRGFQTVVLPNGYLYHWLLMICLNFYLAQLKEPWEFIFAVNRFYFNRFYAHDNREPSYRHFVVISKKGALDQEALRKVSVSPDTSPMPDLGTVLKEMNRILDFVHTEEVSRLADELGALRKKRDELSEKLDRTTVRLETLRAELEGIKSTRAYRIYRKTVGRFRKNT